MHWKIEREFVGESQGRYCFGASSTSSPPQWPPTSTWPPPTPSTSTTTTLPPLARHVHSPPRPLALAHSVLRQRHQTRGWFCTPHSTWLRRRDDRDELGLPPPPSSAASTKPVSSAKPKSKAAKARSPSPSPPPPPAPPLQTVRLDIRLGGPSNYEVDIARQAKDTGQRPPTPPPAVKKPADFSDSEEDDEEKKDGTKKKKRKKNTVPEYYDTSDPFIDDSELALDQRQFFAQTKQQGFTFLVAKSAKKPKSKKISFAAGLHPSLNPQTSLSITSPGTRDAPLQSTTRLFRTPPRSPKQAQIPRSGRPRADSARGRRAPRRRRGACGAEAQAAGHGDEQRGDGEREAEEGVDEKLFHPDLQRAIAELRVLIKQESWENKGKFPPALKPALAKLAILAIRLDEYDDDFFSLMPTLFPEHLTLLTERQDVLLAQLAQLAREGFEKAKEEWEKSVVAWGRCFISSLHRPSSWFSVQTAGEIAPGSSGGEYRDRLRGADASSTEEMDVDGRRPPRTGRTAKTARAMKAIVWELVLLSNECCRLENEKNQLEGSVIQVSDQGLRKVLYQKIVAAYPEGWMSSGQISRDVSAMKKRLEREAMEQADDD
ncbi:hypothetical protein BJ912DRAFT_1061445 [Pholiota molesta]|nr:hypothetical protein BJ912DRAFT_1061445 [Pholiota molesta]